MKKVIMKSLALLLAILSVCSLVACKDKVVQTGELDDTSVPPEVSGTIKFSYAASTESQKNAANAYIDAFNAKYPGVTVERDYDYKTDMAAQRISAGNIGDVFYFGELDAYNFAVTQSALMPLDYYMVAFNIDTTDIYSGIYSAGLINDKYYYVARDFNQMILIYNRDKLVSEGLQQVDADTGAVTGDVSNGWDWATFLDVCEKVTDDTYYGAQLNLAYDPVFIPLLEAYTGRNKWYSLEDREVDLTSGDTLKAVQELIDAYRNGYINLQVGNQDAFADKQPVFRQNVYIQVESIGREYDNNMVEWDMIHLPLTENPAFGCGSSGVGVYNGTHNPNAAAAFALFFYTQEGQTAFNGQDGGSVPVLASLKDADFWRHADDLNGWDEKNWNANVYMSDDYAVIGQFECVLPPEVASILNDGLMSALEKVIAGEDLNTVFLELETQANEKWSALR